MLQICLILVDGSSQNLMINIPMKQNFKWKIKNKKNLARGKEF